MGKSIVYRTLSREFEISKEVFNTASLVISSISETSKLLMCKSSLNLEELKGVIEILEDLRWDIERSIELAKPESNDN